MFKRITAAAGTAALLGGLGVAALASAGAASATSVFTATTSLTNRPDGGHNPLGGFKWATDTLTRVATLTDMGAAQAKGQELYSLHLADTGTFATSGLAGNPSGAQPTDPTDATNGTVTGSGDFTFTVSQSVSASTGGVPAHMDGPPPVSSANWPALFFPKGTTITYVAPNGDEDTYSYTYTDSATCEQWVDSSTNGDGGLPGDGGISGDGNCKLTIGPVSAQTATVGQSFSFQVPATTGSSAGGLTFSFTGLGDGLSGSASGLITGKATTEDALTVTATVRDAVGDNCPQNVEPSPVVLEAATNVVLPPEDDNGSCSVTFEIDVVAPKPAPNPTPAPTQPPTTTITGVPSGSVQTGGGLPVHHSETGVVLGVLGIIAALGVGGTAVYRLRRQQG